MARILAIAFDAYGTLLDLSSVTSELESLDTKAKAEFASIWRTAQLEYTWLRSLMSRYVDFERVSEDAFEYAARVMRLRVKGVPKVAATSLAKLRCFPDVLPALVELKKRSARMVILSNGTKRQLSHAIESNGLAGYFDKVLSADAVNVYKPEQRVYQLAATYFKLRPKDILFVSSNSWDVAGGASFGFKTAWCNRTQAAFHNLGFKPNLEIRDLGELVNQV